MARFWVHIFGAEATTLLGEAGAALAFEYTDEDLGDANHAHPTLAEIVQERPWQRRADPFIPDRSVSFSGSIGIVMKRLERDATWKPRPFDQERQRLT